MTTTTKAASIERKIDRETAKTAASHFIIDQLPDRFCAGQPRFVVFPIRTVWSVPIVLAYPNLGTIGEVGTIVVDAEVGTVVGWTPFEDIYAAARELYEARKAEIEAPVL